MVKERDWTDPFLPLYWYLDPASGQVYLSAAGGSGPRRDLTDAELLALRLAGEIVPEKEGA